MDAKTKTAKLPVTGTDHTEVVSVVVPIYNGEGSISTCISSILGQTYEHIELILVNDGSTDETSSICHKHANADKRIRVLDQENAGVSAARNNGIALSTGVYLTFVDADDTLRHNAIEKMLNELRTSKADCIRTTCETLHNDKLMRVSERVSPGLYNQDRMRELVYEAATGGLHCYSVLLLIKSDLLKYHKIEFPLGVSMMEDAWFYFSLLSRIESIYLSNTITYTYLIHGESASRSINGFTGKVSSVIAVNKYITGQATLSVEQKREINAVHAAIITSLFMVRADKAISFDQTLDMLKVVNQDDNVIELYSNSNLGYLSAYNRVATWAVVKDKKIIIRLLMLVRKLKGK